MIPAMKQMHPGIVLRDDPADRFLALLLDIADERPGVRNVRFSLGEIG